MSCHMECNVLNITQFLQLTKMAAHGRNGSDIKYPVVLTLIAVLLDDANRNIEKFYIAFRSGFTPVYPDPQTVIIFPDKMFIG